MMFETKEKYHKVIEASITAYKEMVINTINKHNIKEISVPKAITIMEIVALKFIQNIKNI